MPRRRRRQCGPDPGRPRAALFTEVAGLQGVEEVARTAFPFIRPKGSDLFPYLEFLVIVGPDGKLGTTVDRPRLIEGRLPDPARAEEFAISTRFVDERDLAVGDRVTFESYAPDQFEALFGSGEAVDPAGPDVTLTVTAASAKTEPRSRPSTSAARRQRRSADTTRARIPRLVRYAQP